MNVKCRKCGHLLTWHHGNTLEESWDGRKYVRTCFGIACPCTDYHGDFPNQRIKIKKKKPRIVRLLKRLKIRLDIIIKRKRKKIHRLKTRYLKKLGI